MDVSIKVIPGLLSGKGTSTAEQSCSHRVGGGSDKVIHGKYSTGEATKNLMTGALEGATLESRGGSWFRGRVRGEGSLDSFRRERGEAVEGGIVRGKRME